MSDFKSKLKSFRKANNLTQEELAEKLFVTRQAVSKWETGANYPDVEKLNDLAKLMNTSIDKLISQEELTYETINMANKIKKNKINNYIIFIILFIFILIIAVAFLLTSKKDETEPTTTIKPSDYELMGLVVGFNDENPSISSIVNNEYAGVFYNYEELTNSSLVENAKIKKGYNYYNYKIVVGEDIIKNEMVIYYDSSLNENKLKIWECYIEIKTGDYFFRAVNPESLIMGDSSIIIFHSIEAMNRMNKESDYKLVKEIFSFALYKKYETKTYEIIEYEYLEEKGMYKKIKETSYEEYIKEYKVQENCDKLIIKQYYGNRNEQEEYYGMSEVLIENDYNYIILNYPNNSGWYTKSIKIIK